MKFTALIDYFKLKTLSVYYRSY